MRPDERVVLELSELQLPTLSGGTDVAVYTNVTADHLDRHGSLGAYRSVKARLAELTRARQGLLVLNDDDPFVAALARSGDRVVRYRRGSPPDGGIGVVDGWVRAGDATVLPLEEIPLPGAHNLSNVLAAVAVGVHFGIPGEDIRGAVAGFPGVEHRLETVAIVGGMRFVNDSQGTQPDAVMAALRAFERPIVLIAGGRQKGLDLSDLAAVVAERVEGVVLIGESAEAFARIFAAAGVARMDRAASMDEAVRAAERMARAAPRGPAGVATVLLSPAAASFDMFEDYAARGRAFKGAVARLVGKAPS
jgi:UDP-N-acetylmuramoylalanine--D-glutamate ligase